MVTSAAPAAHPPLNTDAVAELGRSKAVLLTTFRRDGTPVPTPIWINVVDGRILLTTVGDSGKVKRIRNAPAVEIAPCTQRGKPTGQTFRATASIVDDATRERALAAKRKRYRSFGLIVRLRGGLEKQIAIAVDPPPS